MPVPANVIGTLRESLVLLRTRRFGTFWFASLLSNIGTWAQQIAQPWLLLSLGASPFLLGLDEFAMDAPVWLLTLLGGLLADRGDRRRIITLFQSIQMLCPVLVAVLLLVGVLRPWMVIVLSLIIGVTDALSMPSFQTIVPSIVERGQIASGLALNSTQFNLSRVLGPAVAGGLITGMGIIACYVVSAASYLPFIFIALWMLPPRMVSAVPAPEDANTVRNLFSGLFGIALEPRLRGALSTVLATSILCGPLITFCPVLVSAGFNGSVAQFSVAIGAFGLGGLLGAAGLLSIGPHVDRRRLTTWMAAAYGLIVILAALTPWLWSLPILLVLAGISMSVSNTSANTVLLTIAEQRRYGQVVSLYMLAMRGGLALGGLLTGLSMSLLGVRHALFLNGLLALIVHLAIGRKWLRSS